MMLGNALKSSLVLSVPVLMMLALNVDAATEKQTVSDETILSRLHSANLD